MVQPYATTSTFAVARYLAPDSISAFIRLNASSPVPSLVSHRRWPWTVMPRGTAIWKSASHVVFVEGTIRPIRLRELICTS